MFDLLAVLFGLAIVATVFTVIGLVLKFVLGVLLIPLQIVGWLLQGVFALVLGIVFFALVLPWLLGALPVVLLLGLLALPVLFVGWIATSCAL